MEDMSWNLLSFRYNSNSASRRFCKILTCVYDVSVSVQNLALKWSNSCFFAIFTPFLHFCNLEQWNWRPFCDQNSKVVLVIWLLLRGDKFSCHLYFHLAFSSYCNQQKCFYCLISSREDFYYFPYKTYWCHFPWSES